MAYIIGMVLVFLTGCLAGALWVEYRMRRNASMLGIPSCIRLPFGFVLQRPFVGFPRNAHWVPLYGTNDTMLGIIWTDEKPTQRQVMIARDFAARQPGWNNRQIIVMKRGDTFPEMNYAHQD